MSSLREFIEILERKNEIIKIDKPVSRIYEIAALTKRLDGKKALLFNNVVDSKFKIITNVCGTRERFALALGLDSNNIVELHNRLLYAMNNYSRPREGELLANNVSKDLSILPIVTHFEKDAGPYITSSIVYAKNEYNTQNASIHRMLFLDDKHLVIRMVEGRHLYRSYQYAKDHGEDLKVTIVIGVHPAVLIAAAYQAAYNFDEMLIASSLIDLRVTNLNGFLIPSHAEFILEGRILKDLYEEEYMVEMLRTYDHKRKQPVFELDRLIYRDDAIYHDILAGYLEHRLLMGMPIEAKIFNAVKDIANVKQVRLTNGGCNWLHAVIQLSKRLEGEPKNVLLAALASHPSLKLAIVVDDDIDINDPNEVEYAIATRFQADEDLIIIKNAKGSSLDPSSNQEMLITNKMGIDATIPLNKRKEGFEIAKIPNENNINIDDYIK